MNEFLAELYNTAGTIGGPTEEDLAKQASVELVTKVAAAAEIDPDALTDEQIQDILVNAAEYQGELDKTASAQTGEIQLSAEDVEKLAEADTLGRAMAHAYVNELAEIEKQAAGKGELLSRLGGAAKRGLQHASDASGVSSIRHGLARRGHAGKQIKKIEGMAHPKSSLGKVEQRLADLKAQKAAGGKTALKGAGRLAAIAGGTTAAAGGGYAAKEALGAEEEFEALALARANEVLEKTAGPSEAEYAQLVEQRAAEILEENGYQVSWAE